MTVLNAIALVCVAMLLGGMAFFAGCVAPVVFTRLPPDVAGRFIRGIFPIYHLWVLGTAAAGVVALLPLRPFDAAALAVGAGLAAWLRQGLMPRINALSDAAQKGDAAAKARFDGAHRLSMRLNVVPMIAAVVILIRFA